MSSPAIFKGCTVRFAYFCNRSSLKFATKNSPRHHFFTCRTYPLAKTAKRVPRSRQKGPQNHPLDPLKTHRRGLRTQSPLKIDFVAGDSPGDLVFAWPGTLEMGPRLCIDIYTVTMVSNTAALTISPRANGDPYLSSGNQ